jgi:hypothetical protein
MRLAHVVAGDLDRSLGLYERLLGLELGQPCRPDPLLELRARRERSAYAPSTKPPISCVGVRDAFNASR